MDKLEEALTEAGTAKEAGDILRGLIQRIVLTPTGGSSLKAELYGDLATITEYAQTKDRANDARSVEVPGDVPGKVSVVAGTRSLLYRTTIRLIPRSPEIALSRRNGGSTSPRRHQFFQ